MMMNNCDISLGRYMVGAMREVRGRRGMMVVVMLVVAEYISSMASNGCFLMSNLGFVLEKK